MRNSDSPRRAQSRWERLRQRWHALLGRDSGAGFTGSGDYWERRYVAGGDSGAGSYNRLANFKAEVLNDFVADNGIGSVIEFGCGDGSQLALANYPAYAGYDVSATAVQACRARFAGDDSKSFFTMHEYDGRDAELALSLDVIYHLVEDAVYEQYMTTLFDASRRHVIVYSSNSARNPRWQAAHVRHRQFTDWVAARQPGWRQVGHIPNRYPPRAWSGAGSGADFYVYGKH